MPRPLPAAVIAVALASCLAACAASAPDGGSAVTGAAAPAASGIRLAADGAQTQASPLRVVDEDSAVAQTIALWRAVTRAPVGAEVTWINPRSGDHGQTLIMREAAIPESDRVCREYRRDDVVGGLAHRTLGQVCQQRDGSWAIISGGGIVQPHVPVIETDNVCGADAGLRQGDRRGGRSTLCRQRDGSWAIVQG